MQHNYVVSTLWPLLCFLEKSAGSIILTMQKLILNPTAVLLDDKFHLQDTVYACLSLGDQKRSRRSDGRPSVG